MKVRRGTVGGWLAAASGAQMMALAFGAATNILYAHFLDPAQIGRFAILLALAGCVLVISDAGLQSLLGREVAVGSVSPRVATGLLLIAVPTTIVVVTGLLYAVASLGGVLFSTPVLSLYSGLLVLELAVATHAFQASLALFQGVGRYSRRSVAVAANGFATTALTALAFVSGGEFAAAIHATAAAYLGVAIVAVGLLVRAYGMARIAFPDWMQSVRRASGLYGNNLLGFMSSTADVLLAAAVLPIATVGYYQVIKKVSLVALAPLTAVLPLVYSHLARLGEGAREPFYRKVQIVAAGMIAIGLIIGAPFARPVLGFVFGPSYAQHGGILIALVGIGALQFTHNLLGYVAASAGRFMRPLAINVTVAVTGGSLAVFLAYVGGLNGFVAGLAIANACGVVVGIRLALEFVPREVFVAPASLVALTAATGAALALFVLPLSVGVSLSIALVVVALGCAALPRNRLQQLWRDSRPFALRDS